MKLVGIDVGSTTIAGHLANLRLVASADRALGDVARRIGERHETVLVEGRNPLAPHDLPDPLRVPEVVFEADEVGARGGAPEWCAG